MRVTLLCCALLAVVRLSSGAAVMSIDLGSEWLKVGVVAPGVPMEIALNKESKRKTPAVIAFRDGHRIFGEDAQTIGLRFPDKSYGYLTDLLGKRSDNPMVELYRRRFPHHRIETDAERGTLVFRSTDGSESYTVEELIAQFVQKARDAAESATGQTVTECVLIVPGYFGQAERRALLAAASLANIKVLQLINDYSAVALNYGIFARKDINETAQYYMFYDMGAYKTSAAIVSYQLVRDKQTRELNPVIQVLGVGYDRTLGGLEMQLRLRDHLADEFNALGKTKTDVRTNARAMAKLFREAGRLKTVLSANANHYAQIEGLLEEHDFRVQVTRERFEELCADLFERVAHPVQRALNAAGLSLDVVRQVILFGGGTRVPKVQERLRAAIGQDLGKNINMDEAAAMGAVYRAADLATGFKVRKFVSRDATLFPVHVTFERESADGAAEKKTVRRTLFGPMNPYPQKKVITFNKHTGDFEFAVAYAELDGLTEAERAAIGSPELARVRLSEVAKVLAEAERSESKGIKAHFAVDESGVFAMTGVELVLQKTVVEQPDESPLSKLGSTISKLFSGEQDEGQVQEEEGEQTPPADKETKDDAATADDGEAKRKPVEQDEPAEKAAESAKPAGEGAPSAKNETGAEAPRSKVVTERRTIPSSVELVFAPSLGDEQLAIVRRRIDEIGEREQRVVRRETALNALESFVIDTNQRLDEREYAECAGEAEAEAVRKACAEVSDWLYEDGEHADAETYERRLAELKKGTDPIYGRHWEHNERPEAVRTLQTMLKTAREFLANGRNFTKEANPDRDVFTPVELETLEAKIDESDAWLNEELAEQAKLKRSDAVRLTVKALSERMASVDREVKYLVNKLKIWKPKVKLPAKEKTTEKKEKKTGKKADKKAEPKDGEVAPEAPTEEVVKPVVEDGEATLEAPTEEVVKPVVENVQENDDEQVVQVEELPATDDEHSEL